MCELGLEERTKFGLLEKDILVLQHKFKELHDLYGSEHQIQQSTWKSIQEQLEQMREQARAVISSL